MANIGVCPSTLIPQSTGPSTFPCYPSVSHMPHPLPPHAAPGPEDAGLSSCPDQGYLEPSQYASRGEGKGTREGRKGSIGVEMVSTFQGLFNTLAYRKERWSGRGSACGLKVLMDQSPRSPVATRSCVTLGKALPFSESSPWNYSDISARQV